MLANAPKVVVHPSAAKPILLVEDERVSMEFLATILRDAGYIVDEAIQGQAAWDKLSRNQNYAVIVTDRIMPQMDGMELSQKIKADARTRHIPIIMQTGATAPEEVAAGIQSGIYYYLTKPYQEEALLNIVKAAIRDRQQQELFFDRFDKQQDAMSTLTHGEFQLATLQEGQNVAFLIGSMFPKSEFAVSGLYELILNAIEHGNLNIGYEMKNQLVASLEWDREIDRRLQLPENKHKKVTVAFVQNDDALEVSITDQGAGFNWWPFLEIEPSRATQSNGRGIAKAKQLCFDALAYSNEGRTVTVRSKKQANNNA